MPKKKHPAKPVAKRKRRPSSGLPSKQDILKFIQNSPSYTGKREIARAFQVKGSDRVGLKLLLREMSDEGLIKGRRKRLAKTGTLPSVTVIEIKTRARCWGSHSGMPYKT